MIAKNNDITERAGNILQSVNLKRTTGRLAVVSALLRAEHPMSILQITGELKHECPDKATVYRTLKTLVDNDVVHRAFLHQKRWHFELADNCTAEQCHPHFTCSRCGRTECFVNSSIPEPVNVPKKYRITHQRLQLEGLCPKCRG